MKKLILFSLPTPEILEKIKPHLFSKEYKNKTVAYITANGISEAALKYVPMWQNYIESNGAKFILTDNSKIGEEAAKEIEKLFNCNILIITGGNCCRLLNNLRKSKLDKAVEKFLKKDEFIYAGFSAGAMLMTPTLKLSVSEEFGEENVENIKDFLGLNIVDYEILPHYEDDQKDKLEAYKKKTQYEVRPITNEEFIITNL